MQNRLLERHLDLARRGEIERDAAQEEVLGRLGALSEVLALYRPNRKSGALGWLLGGKDRNGVPRGLYIWGSVGRGKTMLMDLFFEETACPRKRRVHFHAFMSDVHARIVGLQPRELSARDERPQLGAGGGRREAGCGAANVEGVKLPVPATRVHHRRPLELDVRARAHHRRTGVVNPADGGADLAELLVVAVRRARRHRVHRVGVGHVVGVTGRVG